MIAPLIPFSVKGVIWYQGESNAGDDLYQKLFTALILDWRTRWGQPNLPFLFVQLPNFLPRTNAPSEKQFGRDAGWTVVREAQLQTSETVPNTGMAVTIDLGDATNLHPLDKLEVGDRLALVARRLVYGENIDSYSPLFDTASVEGDKIRLKFKYVGTGLKTGNSPVTSGTTGANPPASELKGFAIAGNDKQFVWAKAIITGPDTIEVMSDKVKQPVAVRYGWANNPEVNLYNSANLPASPFKTDK